MRQVGCAEAGKHGVTLEHVFVTGASGVLGELVGGNAGDDR
jgi:hypothetical protein